MEFFNQIKSMIYHHISTFYLRELADPEYTTLSPITPFPFHWLLIAIPLWALIRVVFQAAVRRFFSTLPRLNAILADAGPKVRAKKIQKCVESATFGTFYLLSTTIATILTFSPLNDIPFFRYGGSYSTTFGPARLLDPAENIRPEWLWHAYICMQVSHYVVGCVTMFLETGADKADAALMLVHHGITLLLEFGAVFTGYRRAFLCCVILHDVADIFLEYAKILVYLNFKFIANILFYIFTAIWFVCRLWIYTFNFLFSDTGYNGQIRVSGDAFLSEEHRALAHRLYDAALAAGKRVNPAPGFAGYGLFRNALTGLCICDYIWAIFIVKLLIRTIRDYNSLEDSRESGWEEKTAAAERAGKAADVADKPEATTETK